MKNVSFAASIILAAAFSAEPATAQYYTTSVIGTGTWVPTWDSTQSYPYQYLKIANDIGDYSYSQYLPPKATASCYTTSAGCPVMVFALPYDLPWNENTQTAWSGTPRTATSFELVRLVGAVIGQMTSTSQIMCSARARKFHTGKKRTRLTRSTHPMAITPTSSKATQ